MGAGAWWPAGAGREGEEVTWLQFAFEHPDQLRAFLKTLRAEGVAKYGPIVLGPEPKAHASVTTDPADPYAAARRKHEVMFAASSIRPPFAPAPTNTVNAPRAIVQRQERDEAANGEGRTTR